MCPRCIKLASPSIPSSTHFITQDHCAGLGLCAPTCQPPGCKGSERKQATSLHNHTVPTTPYLPQCAASQQDHTRTRTQRGLEDHRSQDTSVVGGQHQGVKPPQVQPAPVHHHGPQPGACLRLLTGWMERGCHGPHPGTPGGARCRYRGQQRRRDSRHSRRTDAAAKGRTCVPHCHLSSHNDATCKSHLNYGRPQHECCQYSAVAVRRSQTAVSLVAEARGTRAEDYRTPKRPTAVKRGKVPCRTHPSPPQRLWRIQMLPCTQL
jgi:hypothetical protein